MATKKKKKVCFDFKVGDRVTVLMSTVMDEVSGVSDMGATGVITSINPQDGFDYSVTFDHPITIFGTVIESRVYKEQSLSIPLEFYVEETKEDCLHELLYREYEIVSSYNRGIDSIKNYVNHMNSYKSDMSSDRRSDIANRIRSDMDYLNQLRESLAEIREKIGLCIKKYI